MCLHRALWGQGVLLSPGTWLSWCRYDTPGKESSLRPCHWWVPGCLSAALQRLEDGTTAYYVTATMGWFWLFLPLEFSVTVVPTYPPCTPVPLGSPSCPSAAVTSSGCDRRHGSCACRRSARRWWRWAAHRHLLRCRWWQAESRRCRSRCEAYPENTPAHQLGSKERRTAFDKPINAHTPVINNQWTNRGFANDFYF